MAAARNDHVRIARTGFASVWSHLVMLAVSGLLLLLAFPRPGWGWLAHVALAPAALVALRSARGRRLAWTAWLVSFAWWLWAIRWMTPVTFGGYAVLSAYMAVYVPAALLLLRWFDRSLKLPAVLALPIAWVAMEYLRSTVLAGGFAWFCLGHSQAPYLPTQGPGRIIQIADLFGQWGVSFLVAMSNGLIVDLLTRPWMTAAAGGGRRVSPAAVRGVLVYLVAVIGAWGYGQYRINETARTTTPGPSIAVVQTNVTQNNKDRPTKEQEAANWQRLLALSRSAAAADPAPRMIVWPETMIPAAINADARQLSPRSQQIHEQIQDLARSLRVNVLAGAHAYMDWQTVTDPGSGQRFWVPGKRYNSVYLYGPDGGQALGRYDKVHRVPFGEFIPWVENWPWLKQQFIKYLSPYDVDYTLQPGKALMVFDVSAGGEVQGSAVRVVTPICFEDVDPGLVRRMFYESGGAAGHKRADVLVNVTNDGWFAGTDQPMQHFQIAVLRCVENRMPAARSVNTGVSGFIDSAGRVGPLVESAGRFEGVDGFAVHRVALDSRTTVFARWGQTPAVLLVCLAAALAVAGAYRRHKMRA